MYLLEGPRDVVFLRLLSLGAALLALAVAIVVTILG